jgi:hypothetical protein
LSDACGFCQTTKHGVPAGTKLLHELRFSFAGHWTLQFSPAGRIKRIRRQAERDRNLDMRFLGEALKATVAILAMIGGAGRIPQLQQYAVWRLELYQ